MNPESIEEAPAQVSGTAVHVWYTSATPLSAEEADGIVLAMEDAARATYQAIIDSREDSAAGHYDGGKL